jgi:bacteriorhodopsin
MLLPRTNDALRINPPVGEHHLSTSGSDWMWTVCAIYCLGLLSVLTLTYFARAGEKIFHYLFTISFFVGSVAYFAMASDLGNVSVVQTMGDDNTRQISWARYVGW